jgi:hypothetical protein
MHRMIEHKKPDTNALHRALKRHVFVNFEGIIDEFNNAINFI